MEIIIKIWLLAMAAYLCCGLLFAMPFVWRGVNRIDEGGHGSSVGFRIIIIPGVIVFWPLLWKKWMQANKHANKQANNEIGQAP